MTATAVIDPATGISSSRATLNGVVNPGGVQSYAWFEYGPTTDYGSTTESQDVGAGSSDVPISAVVSGLQPSTTYHCRCAIATSSPPPPSDVVDAWLITQQLNQTDPNSGAGNHYSFGWTKSARSAPHPDWETNGYLAFADYPDELVLVNAKKFAAGFPGATTNFHLVGGDGVHNGVSPIRSDWHEGRGVYEVVCQAQGDGTGLNYHWTIATSAEIDRAATYTEEWHIRWRSDFTGYIHLNVLKDGQPWRSVVADGIRTRYVEQQPEVFVWLGGYESSGVSQVARTYQTLDYRGHDLTEALADTPSFGSEANSVSTVSGPDSSVVQTGTLVLG